MIELNMSLARHNELKAMYGGQPNGIHNELKIAGFDLNCDWSVGQEKETGNMIFMQAEPKPVDDGIPGKTDEVEPKKPKQKGKKWKKSLQ